MDETATYDIAVSFTEEQRAAAGEVVEACRQRGLTVLYGPDHTHEWWARKTDGDLPDARVLFFLPFVSTTDEFTSAMLRAVRAGDEHVLPVLVDGVAVPAGLLHPHITYLRSVEYRADQLAEALGERVEAAEWERAAVGDVVARVLASASPAEEKPAEVAVPATFSRYTEQDRALRYLGEQFAAAMPKLTRDGLVGTVNSGHSRIAVRVERAGDIVYALDIQRGGIGGDETVNFVVGRHDAGSVCSNGWARPVYDTAAGRTALELHDLSVLGGGSTQPRNYTGEDLFAALWQRIEAAAATVV